MMPPSDQMAREEIQLREAVLRERREAFIWLFKAGDVVFVVGILVGILFGYGWRNRKYWRGYPPSTQHAQRTRRKPRVTFFGASLIAKLAHA